MLVKSFEPTERNLLKQFFADRALVAPVFDRHRAIVDAIRERDAERAVGLMRELLEHGRTTLQRKMEALREAETRAGDSLATGT
jgi:DNA-binding GntR family transcriptional regulator